jgi:Rps23 Pro-64 3,4-dihydroxylase Tpa1-like proline 4-hydroxylase
MPDAQVKRFYDDRNEATRIDLFDEVNELSAAALRSFFRRMHAPHLFDEIVLPLLSEGDSQIFAAVRDRPWPPWGLGARYVTAVCQTHLVGDDTYGVSPVYVCDEDLGNAGLIAAVYKEAIEYLATNERAEINYLVVEGSMLADHVLRAAGFEKTEDVFLTEAARYFTYRVEAQKLVGTLGLSELATPDLLAHALDAELLARNALFHSTVYLGSRAEWTAPSWAIAAEVVQLVRGGHYSKPGGVPTGTGRFGWVERGDPSPIFVLLENFLSRAEQKELMELVLGQERAFETSTVVDPGAKEPNVNERVRRSRTLDDLGRFGSLFEDKIKESVAEVLSRLGETGFSMGPIEMQVTASGDGDYFRMHQDADEGSSRQLSFVYFFHGEPRRFSGGELRLFETEMIDGRPVPTDRGQTLVPRQNAIVFFPSRHEHEVLPVRVPSKQFRDSRFTLNGWIHAG